MRIIAGISQIISELPRRHVRNEGDCVHLELSLASQSDLTKRLSE